MRAWDGQPCHFRVRQSDRTQLLNSDSPLGSRLFKRASNSVVHEAEKLLSEQSG